jgi:hypothetical protein
MINMLTLVEPWTHTSICKMVILQMMLERGRMKTRMRVLTFVHEGGVLVYPRLVQDARSCFG